jgi:hypothetical protein
MERKIVALIRKYVNAPFRLDKSEIWADNLETAFEAARAKGHGELAEATYRKHMLSDPALRRSLFETMPNPLEWAKEGDRLIEKYKEYL